MKYTGAVKALVLMGLMVFSFAAWAQTYKPVDKGSQVEFTFKKGKGDDLVQTKASFSKLFGMVQFDPNMLQHALFDISLTTSGLRAAGKENEAHLRNFEFFDVSDYPAIVIKSTSVTQDRPGSIVYLVNANLTIKGITRPVKIQFTTTPSGTGYMFHGLLQFSRKAYGLGTPEEFDDMVTVYLQVNTAKK